MTKSQKTNVLIMLALLFVLSSVIAFGPFHRVTAASTDPADIPPDLCPAVAIAGGIVIYHCEDFDLFMNDRGFMLAEP